MLFHPRFSKYDELYDDWRAKGFPFTFSLRHTTSIKLQLILLSWIYSKVSEIVLQCNRGERKAVKIFYEIHSMFAGPLPKASVEAQLNLTREHFFLRKIHIITEIGKHCSRNCNCSS